MNESFLITHGHQSNPNAYTQIERIHPHETLLGTQRVSNPATRRDLAARTWGVFWYESKRPVLFEIMVQIKRKRGPGVENALARRLWCGIGGASSAGVE